MSVQDKKRTLKEFQWFQIQTKVRQIISEILQPIQKKLFQSATHITRLQQKTSVQQLKVKQVQLMISNDPKIFQIGIFKRVDDKFNQQKIQTLQLTKKVKDLELFIQSKSELMEVRMNQAAKQIEQLGNLREFVDNQGQNMRKSLIQCQKNLFSQFQTINKEITDLQINIDGIKRQQNNICQKMSETQQIVLQSQKKVQEQIKLFSEQLPEMSTQIEIFSDKILSLQDEIGKATRMQAKLSKLDQFIKDQAAQLYNLDYKIQVIQPLVSLTQINQYAHHFLPEKSHNNIDIYFYNRYRILAEQVLQNTFDPQKLRESTKGHIDLVKNVHSRSIKLMFRLKKQKLASQGIDIDVLSHQRKMALLEGCVIQQELGDWGQSQQSIKKKQMPEMQKIQSMQSQILNDNQQFRNRIIAEIADSKYFAQNIQSVLRKEIQVVQNTVDLLSKQNKQLKAQMQLQSKLHGQGAFQIAKKMIAFNQWQSDIQSLVHKNTQMIMTLSEIQRQDQLDRKNIILLGIKEKHKDPVAQASKSKRKQIVELNNNCLSCSGNPNYYNEFFKMACLNYVSSPLKIDGEYIDRLQAIQRIQKQMTDVLGKDPKSPQSPRKSSKGINFSRYQSAILPVSRDTRSASNQFQRKISQQFNISSEYLKQKSPQEDKPRIIDPRQMTGQLLSRAHNRIFSRKMNRSYQKSKEKSLNEQRSGHMMHVSQYFRQLKKRNSDFLHN